MSVFHPDTRGRWWTLFFLGSLVQSCCEEGGTLQTNNTGVCSQCLSHTGPAPARSTHSSGSRLLHQEPSEASPGLHAPPRSKLLRLRHSGSPQRRRLCWACVLSPSQVRAARVFGERGRCDLSPFPSLLRSLRLIAFPVPAAQFSGCSAGAPSQADGDCQDPKKS